MTREQWETHLMLKGWWGEYLPPAEHNTEDPMWFICNGRAFITWHANQIACAAPGGSDDVDLIPLAELPEVEFWKIIEFVEAHPEIL